MLHCKIKTEKSDAGARNRLDAVLQGLVERSDSEREQNEEDSGKIVADSLRICHLLLQGKGINCWTGVDYLWIIVMFFSAVWTLILTAPIHYRGSIAEPSSRFPQHRRKKRKEMDDGLADTSQNKQNAYVIKLFDRSVDLAQFSTTTPLYPICRAWMRNNPSMRERTEPSPPHSSGEDEMTDMLNGKGQNVYRLPPPVSCPVGAAGEPVNLRIPPVEKPTESQSVDAAAGTSPLIFSHIKRWKKIRQKWKEASSKNQLRYSESIKILKEMYER